MIQNFSIPLYNESSYNPGCSNEIQGIINRCTTFRADVTNQLSEKFHIALICLVSFIVLKTVLDYSNFSFKSRPFYKWLEFRLDFIMIILAAVCIVFMFV
jgi:hypothetical protein